MGEPRRKPDAGECTRRTGGGDIPPGPPERVGPGDVARKIPGLGDRVRESESAVVGVRIARLSNPRAIASLVVPSPCSTQPQLAVEGSSSNLQL